MVAYRLCRRAVKVALTANFERLPLMYHLAGLETRSPVLVQFDHMVIEEGNATAHRQKALGAHMGKGGGKGGGMHPP